MDLRLMQDLVAYVLRTLGMLRKAQSCNFIVFIPNSPRSLL